MNGFAVQLPYFKLKYSTRSVPKVNLRREKFLKYLFNALDQNGPWLRVIFISECKEAYE